MLTVDLLPAPTTYIEISIYAFERNDADGSTQPVHHPSTKPDGWCVYVLERGLSDDEVVNTFEDEDFNSYMYATQYLDLLFDKYPDAALNEY